MTKSIAKLDTKCQAQKRASPYRYHSAKQKTPPLMLAITVEQKLTNEIEIEGLSPYSSGTGDWYKNKGGKNGNQQEAKTPS